MLVKGIFSEFHNIFYGINQKIIKKAYFKKFQLIPILRNQILHDYVCFIAPVDYYVELKSRVWDSLWKFLSFHSETISA